MILEFKKVSKSFGEVHALKDISFSIKEGEFVFITGPSGAGKTTLLRLLIKEITPTSGEIIFDKQKLSEIKKGEIPELRQKIGSVFQDYKLLRQRTIRENIEVAMAVKGIEKDEWEKRVQEVLGVVGLTDHIDMFPAQLSGGELQRAAIARALIIEPKIIFADEPTGNLDWETTIGIMELLNKINKEGRTILITTHDQSLIKKMKKRTIEIKK